MPTVNNALPTTCAGVGYSEKPSARDAGIEAAKMAFAQARTDACDLVFLFATAKQDPAAVRDGVRSVVGSRPRMMGGASVGVITNDFLGYEGHQVGVAVVKSAGLRVGLFHEPDIYDREHDVGVKLGRQIRDAFPGDQPGGLMIMYDIVKNTGGIGGKITLNLAAPLLAGMTASIGEWPTTAGGALMGDIQFSRGFQWIDDTVVFGSAAALTVSGSVKMDVIHMHGCRPSGRYRTVTKADGNMVLEIDGRPALDAVDEMLGADDRRSWEDWPMMVVFGINNGDKFGPFREGDYSVRLCSAVDKARGGLAFFGDDLQPGREFQLMRRSLDLDYMRARVEELKARVIGRRPILAVYNDCAGRCSAMMGTDVEEATEIQKALGSEVPLLGFYVGGEIARAGTRMQHHNYSGVLSILSEDAPS